MIERRLVKRLRIYWERIKRDREVPHFKTFNPVAVSNLWKDCFHVSVHQERGKITFVYRYIGENLNEIIGQQHLNAHINAQMPFIPIKHVFITMNEMFRLESFECAEHGGNFVDQHSHVIKYRSCILPFGVSKDNITDFIVGVSWISLK